MKKLIIAMLLVSVFLLPKESLALSCAEPSPPDVAYDEYDAVVVGTVEDIEYANEEKIITIEVDKSFKGVTEKSIQVKEDITWGESQLNLDYVYFLNKEGNDWIHPLCSPTTNNIGIADEFFANKKELTLETAEANENKQKHTSVIVILVGLVTIVVASIWMVKRKRK